MTAVVICAVLSGLAAPAVDYASVEQLSEWLRHPVYGDPSFDAFERLPGNPVLRGKAPYEWPVNGYLFEDPVSGDWFLYVGHYCLGYALVKEHRSICTVSRSRDHGMTWEDLGPIFPADEFYFTGEVSPQASAPDVTVAYADGRYHLAFDWTTENTTWANAANPPEDANSGGAYAWAESPAGPWHREARPVVTTRDQTPLLGKYRRMYGTTIVPRADDWLALTLTDSQQHFGWGFVGMTAPAPEGPYSAPVLLLHPERSGFHPPLLEFHPAFVHDGFVYASATSVALNRNYQMLFRAPLEQALNPDAWEVYQHGSLWHAEPVENETAGIWGQTFSGFVGADGLFTVMFPSRDSAGMGTINLARRRWDTPCRAQGFVLSGHAGPSLTRLRTLGNPATLHFEARLKGEATVLLSARGPLGPNQATSDATLHGLCMTDYTGVELRSDHWALVTVDTAGARDVVAEGPRQGEDVVQLAWGRPEESPAKLSVDGKEAWSGRMPAESGALGLFVGKGSRLDVTHVETFGLTSAEAVYLYTEALLGAAQQMNDWEAVEDATFRYGVGAVSRGGAGVHAKWNIEGSAFSLWAPKGPEYGRAAVVVDGVRLGEVDYHSDTPQSSTEVFRSTRLQGERHGVFLEPTEGRIPVDVLVVNPF